jgi:hypothetical protein
VSHIVELELGPGQAITDLRAIQQAARRAGLTFKDGKSSFTYWNGASEPCLHAIGLKNGREIGVTAARSISGAFELKVDDMDRHKCDELLMFYQMEAARLESVRLGDIYSEERQTDGSYVVRIDTSIRMGG